MAKASNKSASNTVLTIGKVEVPVGLFTTKAKPGGLAEFATAGPSGGVLKAIAVATPTPVDDVDAPDVPVSDPFADDLAAAFEAVRDPGPEPGKPDLAQAIADKLVPRPAPMTVQGEYQRKLMEDGTGEIVEPENIRRGVRLEDGSFIDCTGQLAQIERDTKLERMDVVSFVDVTQVPRSRVVGAYYIGAGDSKAPKPLRLIYEALKATRRGAVVKLTKRSRQSLGVIAPYGGTLVLYELVWREDFREAPARALALQKAEVSAGEVAMAVELIKAMSATVESLDELRDDAIARRETLYERALRGEVEADIADAVAVAVSVDDNVMAMLEASLAQVA